MNQDWIRFLTALATAPFALWLWLIGLRRYQFGQRMAQGQIRPSAEVESSITPLPDALLPADETLRALGFALSHSLLMRYDEATRTAAGGRLMDEFREWVYRNPDTQTAAIVQPYAVPDGFVVQFETEFRGGALVSTGYPAGPVAGTSDLHMQFSVESIDAAYRYQLEMAGEWRERFGDPLPFGTPQESAARSLITAKQHAPVIFARMARTLSGQAWQAWGFAMFIFLIGWAGFIGNLILPPEMNAAARNLVIWVLPVSALAFGIGRKVLLTRGTPPQPVEIAYKDRSLE